MALKKGGAKAPVKKAVVKKAVKPRPKAVARVKKALKLSATEKLFDEMEHEGVLLEPARELSAKPVFPEIKSVPVAAPVLPEAKSIEVAWWKPSLEVFSRLSGWILAPLIIGILLGKWLDRKYNTGSLYFFITISIFFIISMFGLVRGALEEFKKIEQTDKPKIKK